MKLNIILTLFIGVILAQEFTADEIIRKVELISKPNTSITEVKLEITRFKRGKEKIKIREFSRFQKFYKSGKFKSKSIIRFHEPKIVKGAGLLSWSRKNGDTDQWIFLPKLKAAKQVKAKGKSKKFMGTDFRYEDLENDKENVFEKVIAFINNLNGKDTNLNEKKFLNSIKSTNFNNLKNKELNEGFDEKVSSKKTGKVINFFNLGFNNRWQKLLPSGINEKLSKKFEKELKELNYFYE